VRVKTESVLRILDANGNRAREGLRTAEDYIRFTTGEGRWAKRLRALRHRVTEELERIASAHRLLAARDVRSDSGHPTANAEAHTPRQDRPRDVALRGLKRGQEAIRVLEEYTRGTHIEAARRFSETRFAAYEAEQWLALCGDQAARLRDARLYVLLTEARCRLGLEATARAALRGGAEVLQLREKKLDGGEQVDRARRLRDVCAEHGALLLVNDRPDVALMSGADGVHVGQADVKPADVRRVSGERLLVGRSTHSLLEARRAIEEEEADYIAVGSMYETRTKEAFEMRGPGLAREVLEQGWDVPVFAIGGITAERIPELRSAGVRRVAVSAAVVEAQDPERAAGMIRKALEA